MTHAHLIGSLAPSNFTGLELVDQIISDLETLGESEAFYFEYAVNNGIIHVEGKTATFHNLSKFEIGKLSILFTRDEQEDTVIPRWLVNEVENAIEDYTF